jgi:3-deoxy-D-manno-octulosonic-acid transferase
MQRISSDFGKESPDVVWMHCASLGEFEQGRPLLEKLKTIYTPAHKIVADIFLTFRVYVAVKGKQVADYVYYLPFGNRSVASRLS